MMGKVNMNNSNIKLRVVVGATVILWSQVIFAQDISGEATSSMGEIIRLVLEIIASILAAGGATYTIWRVYNIKKQNVKNTLSTEGEKSPVGNVTTSGDNSPVNNQGGIIGNNNTINNGLTAADAIKIAEIVARKDVDPSFETDKKTIENLFSHFNTTLFNNFISGQNLNYIDNRIFAMHGYWYNAYNPIEPVFNDGQTAQVLKEFYVAFNALIAKCTSSYDQSTNPNLSHIHGLVCDVFDNPEDEKKFDEIVKDVNAITPIYENMIKLIVQKYNIDLNELSAKFEKEGAKDAQDKSGLMLQQRQFIYEQKMDILKDVRKVLSKLKSTYRMSKDEQEFLLEIINRITILRQSYSSEELMKQVSELNVLVFSYDKEKKDAWVQESSGKDATYIPVDDRVVEIINRMIKLDNTLWIDLDNQINRP